MKNINIWLKEHPVTTTILLFALLYGTILGIEVFFAYALN